MVIPARTSNPRRGAVESLELGFQRFKLSANPTFTLSPENKVGLDGKKLCFYNPTIRAFTTGGDGTNELQT